MDAELTRRLVEIAGAGGVVEKTSVVIPRDADMVAAIARACAETLTPMTVSSGASGTDRAAPPRGVVISLSRLTSLSIAAGGGALLCALLALAIPRRLDLFRPRGEPHREDDEGANHANEDREDQGRETCI